MQDSAKLDMWCRFKDREQENLFLNATKNDNIRINKYGFIVAGIGYLLVGIADFYRLNAINSILILSVGARLLFFAFCLVAFFAYTPQISIKRFNFIVILFAFCNSTLLLFLVFILNQDLSIDTIDTITIPFITLMILIILRIGIMYLFANAVYMFIGYFVLLEFIFKMPADFNLNMLGLYSVLMLTGGHIALVTHSSRRKEFAQAMQISSLNTVLEHKINEQNHTQIKLEETLEELSQSINYAQKLQQCLLPCKSSFSSSISDHFILFKPKDVVSGDFYWTYNSGDIAIVAVADCTGHGIPGAFMSVLGISLLNKIVDDRSFDAKSCDPALLLNNLRKDMIASMQRAQNGFNYHDGMDIALCVIDAQKKELRYAGAYSKIWHVRNQNGQTLLTTLKGDSMPIGTHVSKNNIPFASCVFSLQNGDCLYFSTDGFRDQLGELTQRRFQSRKFVQLIEESYQMNMTDQKNAFEKTLEQWQGETSQVDDILVIGIRLWL